MSENYYIVSPSGKLSAVTTEEERDNWLQAGFRAATEDEIATDKRTREAARARLQLHAELDRTGTDIHMVSVPAGKDGYGTSSQAILTQLQTMGVKISTTQLNQKIGFIYHSPDMNIWTENPVKIIYTMFESTKIPEPWVGYLKQFDRVLVPSHYCMEVFARFGIAADVVPLGFDEQTFPYIDRTHKESDRTDFTFLHYNAFNARKGFLELFAAFQQAFTPEEPVRLILKTNDPSWRGKFPFITETRNPNIQVIDTSLSDAQLVQLLRSVDAFVFPSKGEGFGLPPLEAMATGLPVLVPNAHGISEYFNPACMYEAKVAGEEPAIYAKYKGMDVGTMVTCDVDDLAAKMRYIYEHQDEAREKGRLAAKYAKQFTYDRTAARLKEIFDEYLR